MKKLILLGLLSVWAIKPIDTGVNTFFCWVTGMASVGCFLQAYKIHQNAQNTPITKGLKELSPASSSTIQPEVVALTKKSEEYKKSRDSYLKAALFLGGMSTSGFLYKIYRS